MTQGSSTTLHRVRVVLWALVVLAGLGATAIYLFRPPPAPQASAFGGPFALESTAGGTFTEADLRGTPSLLFFGYTFCPDVCPMTLAEATAWRQALDLGPEDLRIVFFTVDPERDTVEQLEAYLSGFSGEVIGLSGSEAAVDQAKAAFGVYAARVDDPAATEYLMDHTASVFLIDAEGEFQGTIAFGEPRDTALAKIRRLVEA